MSLLLLITIHILKAYDESYLKSEEDTNTKTKTVNDKDNEKDKDKDTDK